MAADIDHPIRLKRTSRHSLWLSILACYSLLLGIITTIPQFYYVLFALHLVTIGPNSNPLGQIWYTYILNGDNSYQKVDPGALAGAVEDAFLLGPLYIATGIGLWLRRPWVIPVGLITGAMIFYAIIGFFLGDIFAGLPSVTNGVSYWASNLPYLIYPLWLIPVLLFKRSHFVRKKSSTNSNNASED
jgi:EXPERA (EXPanded EBP superfamily)